MLLLVAFYELTVQSDVLGGDLLTDDGCGTLEMGDGFCSVG